jgi:septal ring factor EnvC (AmiA/AmiB activator)
LTLIFLILPFHISHAASPETVKLENKINRLESKLNAVEAITRTFEKSTQQTKTVDPITAQLNQANKKIKQLEQNIKALQQQFNQLEQQKQSSNQFLSQLEELIRFSGNNVVIETNGKMTLKSVGELKINGQSLVTITSKGSAKLNADGNLNLITKGRAKLNALTILLNNGTKPAAYLGAGTIGGPNAQVVKQGSSTVLLP